LSAEAIQTIVLLAVILGLFLTYRKIAKEARDAKISAELARNNWFLEEHRKILMENKREYEDKMAEMEAIWSRTSVHNPDELAGQPFVGQPGQSQFHRPGMDDAEPGTEKVSGVFPGVPGPGEDF